MLRVFCTSRTPQTWSARSSARRFAWRDVTVPESCAMPCCTLTWMPEASNQRSSVKTSSKERVDLKIFLIGDAVGCAKVGQKTPEGAYNLGRMLKGFTSHGIPVGACGRCMDARGLT